MLRDWQLSNPTGSLLKIVPTAHQGEGHGPSESILLFFCGREDAFYAKFTASAAITNRRRKKNPSIAMPTRETPVESGDLLSSVGTGLPRTCVLCAWVVNAMGIRMHIIHNKSFRDLHRISSSTFDF